MSTYAQADRKTAAEWLKLGYKPLKGEVGLHRHGEYWFTANQVVSKDRPKQHP